jgi:hypothetical protein
VQPSDDAGQCSQSCRTQRVFSALGGPGEFRDDELIDEARLTEKIRGEALSEE